MSVVLPQPPLQLQKARAESKGMSIDCTRKFVAMIAAVHDGVGALK
jgi:hypothetical protein